MGLFKRAMDTAASKVQSYADAPDLQSYAAGHGLTYVGNEARILGVGGVNTSSDNFNLMHGSLPGGVVGALCHVKQATGETPSDSPSGGQTTHSAHTRIATNLPEALGSLRSFELTNNATSHYMRPVVDAFNSEVDLEPLGFNGGAAWGMAAAVGTDLTLLQQLLSTDFGARLRALGGRFYLVYDQGTLFLGSGDGYATGPELDALCEQLGGLANTLREAALAAARPQAFDAELPAPAWLSEAAPQQAPPRKFMGMSVQVGASTRAASDGIGGLGEPLCEPYRGAVANFSQATGATLEDALAFHRAHPAAPVPGRAYAVARAQLESGGTGRIAFCTPHGGPEGGLTAVISQVTEGTPDVAIPIGGDAASTQIAVGGGLMAAWRYSPAGEIDAAAIGALSQQAWNHARAQGWVAA